MSTDSQKPLILIDGSSYLFRAYYALPPLVNTHGEPTGAIYGVVNMLKKIIHDYQPTHIAAVFDPKGKNFRHALYPDYKANRSTMPDELAVQIQPLFKIIQALGIPLVIHEGVEADDVIATLAVEAEKQGMQTVISTGDKDLAQIVNDHITLINTMTSTKLDRQGVQQKFGVSPEQMIDYLALVGDTSDNIPGVPKVGPKTAVKWLAQYHTIDNLMVHADDIRGKVGENLRANVDNLKLARQLVTIHLDIPVDEKPQALLLKTPDQEALMAYYQRNEFKKWLAALQTDSVPADQNDEVQYDIILEEKMLKRWIKQLKKASVFAFDTETTGLNAMQADLVGVSFSIAANQAAYVPVSHDYLDAPKQLDKAIVLAALKPLLENPNNTIIGQNLKYDYKVLARQGIHIKAAMIDTMLQSYVLDSGRARHGLDALANHYLQKSLVKFEDIAGKGVKQLSFNQIALEQAGPYAAEDADIAWQLHQVLSEKIEQDDCFIQVLNEIELPLLPVLTQMEINGVLIDKTMLLQQSDRLAQRLAVLEQESHEMVGEAFNLSSTKQLSTILYEKLKIPILKKTPKGAPSTAESVLQELAMNYPLPKLILEYRRFSKLKSTYTDKLPMMIDPDTGRVHTSYHQAGTSTGRLSSSDPNLQNIPIKSAEGRKIRQAFIAPPGYQILAADYSQVELRIMAHLSQDPGLMAAFEQGLDVHKATAAEIFELPIDKVTSEYRRRAKAINFGLIYGMSSFGLSQQLGIDRKTAQHHMDVYFEKYPGVLKYMELTRRSAAEKGYVETLLGRRLLIPDIQSSNIMRKKAAERAAINAPMQGTAADIIKLAMIHMQQWMGQNNPLIKMIMQVHDELVFEIEKNEIQTARVEIKRIMENAATLSVPLIVDIGVGDNWDEAH